MNTHALLDALRMMRGQINAIHLVDQYVSLTMDQPGTAKSRLLLDLLRIAADDATVSVAEQSTNTATLALRAGIDRDLTVSVWAIYHRRTEPEHVAAIAELSGLVTARTLVATLANLPTQQGGRDVTPILPD